MKIGQEKPTNKVVHGKNSKLGGALFSNENNCQFAQLDDLESEFSHGWWKFPANTFVQDEEKQK